MKESLLSTVLLPAALGLIMLGLGLTLTLADFKRVIRMPRAVIVGLACQMLVLPMVAYGLVVAFALPPELGVGMILLAATPGSATANLFTHLARADVALNITLTAVNSLLSLFTLPLVVNFALEQLMGESRVIPLQFAKVLQIFAIVLIPVGIGMLIRGRRPAFAARMERPVRVLSALILAAFIAAAIIKEHAILGTSFAAVGLAALTFNLLSLGIGYAVPRLARLPRPQAIAIGMEIGVHNGTLAIALAVSPQILNNSTMSIPPAVYSLIMLLTAAGFGWLMSRRATAEHETPSR